MVSAQHVQRSEVRASRSKSVTIEDGELQKPKAEHRGNYDTCSCNIDCSLRIQDLLHLLLPVETSRFAIDRLFFTIWCIRHCLSSRTSYDSSHLKVCEILNLSGVASFTNWESQGAENWAPQVEREKFSLEVVAQRGQLARARAALKTVPMTHFEI